MIHEPECQHYVEEARSIRTGACIFCAIARAAYQRGREDAAKAVEATMLSELDEPLTEYELAYVAAARGEGELA